MNFLPVFSLPLKPVIYIEMTHDGQYKQSIESLWWNGLY